MEMEIFSVNWDALYPSDYYEQQETVYREKRIELSSDTLAVRKYYIRKYIEDLVENDRAGIRKQIEAFRQSNPRRSGRIFSRLFHPIELNGFSEPQSMATTVDRADHVLVHQVQIDQINNDELHLRYFVIEAVQRMNIITFWHKIWDENVSSIVMIYGINEDVSRTICIEFHRHCLFLLIEFICTILAK